jgi:RNA polymerase sigma-70 factor (sigma-E family)
MGPVGFDDWVAARGPALLRLAHLLTGGSGEAEDVVQDALSRALPRWDRISRLDDPDAYVRRMVVNAHTSWWRRFRRREAPVADVRPSAVVAGPEAAMPVDERARVWQACRALPEAQRTAVVLRFYEQLEYAEIAALTGVREGTVRSRVSRGLAVLRVELADGARRRARTRRRTTLAAAAAAVALVVGVPAVVVGLAGARLRRRRRAARRVPLGDLAQPPGRRSRRVGLRQLGSVVRAGRSAGGRTPRRRPAARRVCAPAQRLRPAVPRLAAGGRGRAGHLRRRRTGVLVRSTIR